MGSPQKKNLKLLVPKMRIHKFGGQVGGLSDIVKHFYRKHDIHEDKVYQMLSEKIKSNWKQNNSLIQ